MKRILLLLLLLFCVSDIQNSHETVISDVLISEAGFPMVMVDNTEMCKPTGVETVTYPEGKAEPAPEKKKTTAKTLKKKQPKKTQPKKA
jgi:hypothetical protein